MAVSRPPITVLMGVYNGLPRLNDAIRSIRGQTFSDFEFLIIDDASTDGSRRAIERHAEEDPRIRVLRNDMNAGLGKVLNRGVLEAKGELIARMDADDVAVPQRLERQLNYFLQHPQTDVLGSYAMDVDNDGRPIRERRVPICHDRIVELVWTSPFIHPTVMFRRESILRVGSYSAGIRRRQDYDLWFRCVAGGLQLANIPEPLVLYHYSEDTMRRNHLRSVLEQVKIGIRGCRLVRARRHAYFATCLPLFEAAMPNWLRLRLASMKSRLDPRRV